MDNKWMYKPHHRFRQGARVRLKDTVDPSIYGDFACVGNEGIVMDVGEDRFGLPEVLVKWDPNHWAYNGIRDCWTFEEHFELVEDSQMDKKDEFIKMLAQGLNDLLTDGEETPKVTESKSEHTPDSLKNRFLQAAERLNAPPDKDDEFTRAVETATAKLAGSDAFIIVGVEKHDSSHAPEGIMEPYALGFSKDVQGDLVVTAYMSKVAAQAHQALALQTLAEMVHES